MEVALPDNYPTNIFITIEKSRKNEKETATKDIFNSQFLFLFFSKKTWI